MFLRFSKFIAMALLILLGIAAMAISASIFIFGAMPVGNFFEIAYSVIFSQSGDLSALTDANVDSELRFYCVFFFAFGAFCLLFSSDMASNHKGIALLMLIFFAGGVGRAVSYLTLAPPSPIYIFLMWVELILPVIVMLFIWLSKARKS